MGANIVVSGGTKGIGRAVAETFAGQGFNVFFCARNAQEVKEFEAELRSVYNINAFGMIADFAKPEGVDAFAAFCLAQAGHIDVLVNNAGVFMPGQIQTEGKGDYEIMMQVNMASAYHLTRHLLPVIVKAGQGYIFNICSTASFTPYINGGSYCISKHALLGFTKVLRQELKPHHIAVSAVMPGATLTGSWAGTDLPEERFMAPRNVAEALLFAWQNRERCVMEEIILRPHAGDIG